MVSTVPPPLFRPDHERPPLHAVAAEDETSTGSEARAAAVADAFATSLKRNRDALIDDLRRELVDDLKPLFADVRAELLSAVDMVRRELADRDADLSAGYEHLADRLRANRATLRGVVEGLDRLARRLPT